MSEDTSKEEEILISRGGTEYEKNGEVHVIDYGGYPLVDINPELITDEISLLAKIADLLEISDEYLSLEGKTQVVNVGVDSPDIQVTTRLIHDMQVSQNAMRIAFALGGSVKDIMLARIGGLGHDIGHAPFGHDGEAALSSAIGEYFPGSRFTHDRYGGDIMEEIIQRAVAKPEEEELDAFIFDDDDVDIDPLKEEIKLAVINHSRYFSYRMKEETLSQRSVRLADTLSFMVTDLSDLMRTEDARYPGTGKRILSTERMLEEIEKMPFLSKANKIKLRKVVFKLLRGGAELKDIHEALIKEAFDENRPILDENESATIVDDIKLLYDIETISQTLEKTDNVKTRIEAFRRIGEYYRYINNLGTNNQIRINYHFKAKMAELLGFDRENEERALGLIETMMVRLGDINYAERDISDIPYFTTSEFEVIKKITDNVLDKDDMNSLRNLAKNASDEIIRADIDNAPMLLTLFTIQNRVQYGEILATRTGLDSLGNDEIETIDGSRKKVFDLVKDRFKIVYKMAREFSKDQSRFTEDSRSQDSLKTYFGMKVPEYPARHSGALIDGEPLSYAVFAIQQMQNKDFLDDFVVDRIRESLGISLDQFKQMQEEIAIEDIERAGKAQKGGSIEHLSLIKALMSNTKLFGELSKEETENPTLDTVIERSRKMDELRVKDILTYEQFEESGLKREWQKTYITSESYFKKLGEIISRQDYEEAAKFLAQTYLRALEEEDIKEKGDGEAPDNPNDDGRF